jgi:hypothetical protein
MLLLLLNSLKFQIKNKEMSMFGEVTMGMSRAVSDDEDDEFSLIKE